MADSEKHKPPKLTSGDALQAFDQLVSKEVPVTGTALTETFRALFGPSIKRRRQEFMGETVEDLAKLKAEKGLDLEDLLEKEIFADVVFQAAQAALRTSQKEKREALRNAIMNSALDRSLDETKQNFFIRLIDEFDARHLRVLKIYSDPWEWAKKSGEDISSTAVGDRDDVEFANDLAFPDYQEQRGFCNQIWRELYLRGLVDHDKPIVFGLSPKKHITPLGYEFLRYIEEPE